MRGAEDVVRLIESQPGMMRALTLAAALALPDAWIGAGFLRNAVWDALHDRGWSAGEGDVDLIYFDPFTCDPTAEKTYEAALRDAAPDLRWSVKNQARMHLRNNDPPYQNTSDAMAQWLETCTAVAARLQSGAVELSAPYGVEDLVTLSLRPTTAGLRKRAAFDARVLGKDWLRRWPKLQLA